jgi:hypothetical protein
MIVNFKARGISRDASKLVRTPMLIIIKKRFYSFQLKIFFRSADCFKIPIIYLRYKNLKYLKEIVFSDYVFNMY